MKYRKYTVPKDAFEYIFEKVKLFYDVTTFFDYGFNGVFIDNKICLPDNVNLYTYESDLASIFDDKLIQRFLLRTGINDSELNAIQWILRGVNTVHIKQCVDGEISDDESFFNLDPNAYFKNNLESELVKLHEFCYKVSSKVKYSVGVTIKTGFGDEIKLDNYANYLFSSALKKYCEDHVPYLKNKTYTNLEPISRNKGGRHEDNSYATSLLYGTFLMLKSFTKDNVDISDGICRIIYRFLKYLGIDTYVVKDENATIKIIRARIKDLQKKSYKPSIGRMNLCDPEEAKQLLQESGLNLYDDLLR